MHSLAVFTSLFRSLNISEGSGGPVLPASPTFPSPARSIALSKPTVQNGDTVHPTDQPTQPKPIQPEYLADNPYATSPVSPAFPSLIPSIPPALPPSASSMIPPSAGVPQHTLNGTTSTIQASHRRPFNTRYPSQLGRTPTRPPFTYRPTEASRSNRTTIRRSATAGPSRPNAMLPFAYVLPQSEIWALRAALAGPDPSPQSIAESFQWNTASPSTEGYKEGTNSEEGTNDEEVKKLEASEEDEDVILFSRIENRQQQIVDNYYELQGRLRDKDIDLAKARNDSERESQEKSEEIHCLQRQLKSTMLQFQDNVCQSEKMSSDLSASMDVNASLLAQVATLEAEVARLAKSLTEDRHAEQVSHDQMKVIECPKCESRHVSHCPCCKAGTRFLPPGPIRSPTGSIRRSSNRKARTSAAIPKWKLRSLRLSRQGRLSAQGLFPPTKAGGVRKSPESSNEVHGVPTTESHIPALQVIDASMEVEAEWPAAVDSNNLHLYRQPVPSNPWADAFFLSGREDLMKSGGHHCMADALVHGEIGDRAQVQSMEWEQATAVEPTGQPPLMTHAAVDAVRNGHNGQVIERGIAANGMGLQTVPLVDATDSGLTASWAAVLAEARHNNLDVRKVILNGARNGDPQAQVALVHLALPLDRPNYHDSFALLVLRGLVDGCDLVQEAVIALGRRATVGGRTYPVEALRKMRRKGHPFATQILAQLSIPAPFAPPPQLILAPVPAPTSVSGPLPTCPIVHDTLACSHGQNNAPDIDCGNVPVPAPSQLGEATAH